LSSTGTVKQLTPSTVVITHDDQHFSNITELEYDKYYVTHPMKPTQLFDLQDLDKIDEFQIIELQSLVTKLGAKSFSCSVLKEKTKTSNNNSNMNIHGSVSKTVSSDADINISSFEEEYENKFTQYNWTAQGQQSSDTKEILMDSLL